MIEKIKNLKRFRLDAIMLLVTLIGSFIYTIGISWFLESNGLYSGGLVGLAQLLTNLLSKQGINMPINIGILNLIFNLPLLYLGFKTLSKRFTIYSTVSIVTQTIILTFLPKISDPTQIDWLSTFISSDNSQTGTLLTASILGGLFLGVGTGLAMKFGSSTAGLDIYAQYYSIKKDKSVGGFFLTFNGIIILIAFIFLSPVLALFTLVRQIIATIALDNVHTSYNYLKIEAISRRSVIIAKDLIKVTGRGVTLQTVKGGFSGRESTQLTIICTSYEYQEVIDFIHKQDKNAFINTSTVSKLEGSFKKRLIGSKRKNH